MDRSALSVFLVAVTLLPVGAWARTDEAPASKGGQTNQATDAAPKKPGTHDPRAYFTDLELLTQDGKTVRFYSDMLDGRIVVINTIYTNCKDACPLITQKLNQVRAQIGGLFGSRVYFISISSDPVRDTPKALKAFARKQEADVPGWTFLTGKKQNVEQILKKLGQFSEDVEDHSTLLIAGDVNAKRIYPIRPDAPVPAIAERLKLLASPNLMAPAGGDVRKAD